MWFSIYGRYDLDIERRDDRWLVYRRGLGVKREDPTIFIPASLDEDDIAAYLDDLLHEEGGPGRAIRRID